MKNEKGYVDSFVKLVQCPTVTNSGSEYFDKFHKVIDEEFPNVKRVCKKIDLGGDMLLYKWEGKSSDKPAVLMAHQDVVPAVGGDWKHDPFSGAVEDGKVWGRGSMDCKVTLFSTIQAVDDLIAEGVVPNHDIYLSYSDSEETSGPGAAKARDWFIKNGIKPAIVLDEGGAIIEKLFPQMTRDIAMVGILEKGYADVKFIAKGKGGHSSQPPKNTPIARLSAFVNYCETHTVFKPKMSNVARQMIQGLSTVLEGPLKFLTKNIRLFSGIVTPLAPKVAPAMGGAIFKTTLTFTMSEGSSAPNIIPEEAWVIANLRFSPNDTSEKCFAKLKKIADKYDLQMDVLNFRDASPCVDTDNDEYKYFIQTIKDTYPEIGISPYLIFGGTDCRTMQEICQTAIRCTPCRMSNQQLNAMHASNENIDIKAMEDCVQFFKNFLRGYK